MGFFLTVLLQPTTILVKPLPSAIILSYRMAGIRNAFGWFRPKTPILVPTDQILPVHDIDNRTATRTVLCWTLRFDDILDADKLHAPLVRLLEIRDWKKLGGRLRRNVWYSPLVK